MLLIYSSSGQYIGDIFFSRILFIDEPMVLGSIICKSTVAVILLLTIYIEVLWSKTICIRNWKFTTLPVIHSSSSSELYCQSAICGYVQRNKMLCLTRPRCYIYVSIDISIERSNMTIHILYITLHILY